ncbi:hypothetical protein BDF22DRAFT_690868 [Syncephalis plumigaleata]|nr:hypothetical protein BDF22DRAFT_690868 [Syncephalis plumigaleata]
MAMAMLKWLEWLFLLVLAIHAILIPPSYHVSGKRTHRHSIEVVPNNKATTKAVASQISPTLVLKCPPKLSARYTTEIIWTIPKLSSNGAIDRFTFHIALGHVDLGILRIIGQVDGRLVGHLLNTHATTVATTNDAWFRFNVTLDDSLVEQLINLPGIQLSSSLEAVPTRDKLSPVVMKNFIGQLITHHSLYLTVWGNRANDPPWRATMYYGKRNIEYVTELETVHVKQWPPIR